MELILCRVAESSCLLTHNIALHISLHDPPYHKTMKKNEDSQSWKLFSSSRRNSRFKHGSVLSTISLLIFFCLSVHPKFS